MKRFMVVCLVAACGSVDNGKTPDAKVADSPPQQMDAAIDAPPAPRCDPTKPFGAPQVLANVNSSADDGYPFITADELQLWFSSNRPGSQGMDIYMASRSSKTADFGQASLLAGVNTAGSDTRPVLTADGLTIYIQYLGSGATYYKVTSSTRSSTTTAFPTPTEVTSITMNGFHDDAEWVLPDHSAIYFNSNRSGTFKFYRAARVNGAFQQPALVDGTDINAAQNDYPTVTPDEKTIYFLSDRTGSVGRDNWKATRASTVQAFGNSAKVTELNVTEDYYLFSVTADDCIAYIHGPNGANGIDMFVVKKPL
jgi:hypothetical protein